MHFRYLVVLTMPLIVLSVLPRFVTQGRRTLAQQSRAGYVAMYKQYCSQTNPKNPEVGRPTR